VKITVYLKRLSKNCVGVYDSNDKSILVKAGSQISLSIAKHFVNLGYFNKRKELFLSDIIRGNIFEEDFMFDKPSAASSVILGSNTNGNIEWITSEGLPLESIGEDNYIDYEDKDRKMLMTDIIALCRQDAEKELKLSEIEFNNFVSNITSKSSIDELIKMRERVEYLKNWTPLLEEVLKKVEELYIKYILHMEE
jgi:hypothetical protein